MCCKLLQTLYPKAANVEHPDQAMKVEVFEEAAEVLYYKELKIHATQSSCGNGQRLRGRKMTVPEERPHCGVAPFNATEFAVEEPEEAEPNEGDVDIENTDKWEAAGAIDLLLPRRALNLQNLLDVRRYQYMDGLLPETQDAVGTADALEVIQARDIEISTY